MNRGSTANESFVYTVIKKIRYGGVYAETSCACSEKVDPEIEKRRGENAQQGKDENHCVRANYLINAMQPQRAVSRNRKKKIYWRLAIG